MSDRRHENNKRQNTEIKKLAGFEKEDGSQNSQEETKETNQDGISPKSSKTRTPPSTENERIKEKHR